MTSFLLVVFGLRWIECQNPYLVYHVKTFSPQGLKFPVTTKDFIVSVPARLFLIFENSTNKNCLGDWVQYALGILKSNPIICTSSLLQYLLFSLCFVPRCAKYVIVSINACSYVKVSLTCIVSVCITIIPEAPLAFYCFRASGIHF